MYGSISVLVLLKCYRTYFNQHRWCFNGRERECTTSLFLSCCSWWHTVTSTLEELEKNPTKVNREKGETTPLPPTPIAFSQLHKNLFQWVLLRYFFCASKSLCVLYIRKDPFHTIIPSPFLPKLLWKSVTVVINYGLKWIHYPTF